MCAPVVAVDKALSIEPVSVTTGAHDAGKLSGQTGLAR
jgi:hypothetical protein